MVKWNLITTQEKVTTFIKSQVPTPQSTVDMNLNLEPLGFKDTTIDFTRFVELAARALTVELQAKEKAVRAKMALDFYNENHKG